MSDFRLSASLMIPDRHEFDFVEQGLKSNHEVIGHSHNIHAAIVSLGASYQAGHYYSLQDS